MEQQEIIESYAESQGVPLTDSTKRAIACAVVAVCGTGILGYEQLALHWDAIMAWVNCHAWLFVGVGGLWAVPRGWRAYTVVKDHQEDMADRQANRMLQLAAIERLQTGTPTKFSNAITGNLIESGTVFPPAQPREKAQPERKLLAAPQVAQPTLRECIEAVVPNSYNLCFGRDRETGNLIVASFNERHLRIIGASQRGKSAAAAALMHILIKTHSPEMVQLALLDLENQTCHLFENAPHVAYYRLNGENIKLVARSPEEVAGKLRLLVEMLNDRYTMSKRQVQALPLTIIYLEELNSLKDYFKSQIQAQKPYGRRRVEAAMARYAQLMYDIREIVRRGLKVRMQVLACAQVDYRDDDLVEAWRNITSGLCFSVKPSAAMAAGFRETELLEVCAKEDKRTQFVAELGEYVGIGLAPLFDLKREIMEWEERMEAGDDCSEKTTPLPECLQPEPEVSNQDVEVVEEASGSDLGSENLEFNDLGELSTVRALREIGKRLRRGEDKTEIVKSFGLSWGRATQELRAVVDMVEEQLNQEESEEEDDTGE
jgi:hypothetical protein